jgi:hypothetical protein
MEKQEPTQRDWTYLLPGGQSAENMKAGRLILSELARLAPRNSLLRMSNNWQWKG